MDVMDEAVGRLFQVVARVVIQSHAALQSKMVYSINAGLPVFKLPCTHDDLLPHLVLSVTPAAPSGEGFMHP